MASGRAQLQAVADAAALSAAGLLPDPEAARSTALQVAAANMPAATFGQVLTAEDIAIGRWDPGTHNLLTDDPNPDSVKVSTRRSSANGNSLGTFLIWLLGVSRLDVGAEAIATMAVVPSGCNGGLFAKGSAETGSNNTFDSNFCLHANDGLKTGSQNDFASGVSVTMHDLSDLDVGASNTGIYEVAEVGSHEFTLIPQVNTMIQAMRAADFSALPPFITKGPVYMDRIRNDDVLVPGTLYIVEGTVSTKTGVVWNDIAIVAGGEVSIGSDNRFWNVVIATDHRLGTGSATVVGEPGYCNTGVCSASI